MAQLPRQLLAVGLKNLAALGARKSPGTAFCSGCAQALLGTQAPEVSFTDYLSIGCAIGGAGGMRAFRGIRTHVLSATVKTSCWPGRTVERRTRVATSSSCSKCEGGEH